MTGFPGLGALRRLRPTHDHQSTVDLSRLRRRVAVDGWDDQWVVPVFTAVHSIEEEPDSAPAASPCLRRRPSARPPRGRASPTPRSSPPESWGCTTPGPDPPGSSRSSVERLYTTSSSRTPLDPCSPGPRHLAVLTHPGFVGAAPTITDTPRLRLPPASADRCDGPQVQVFHLHSNSSASRRTKPALNAFAITFQCRIPTT